MSARFVCHGGPSNIWMGFLLAACMVTVLGGCGDSDEGTDPIPTLTYVEQGWEAFEAGDFTGASSYFAWAIAEDPADSEAHNGLGWATMKLFDLQDALISFDAALTHGFSGADPHAGKAILLRDLEPVDYAAAIASAGTALGIELPCFDAARRHLGDLLGLEQNDGPAHRKRRAAVGHVVARSLFHKMRNRREPVCPYSMGTSPTDRAVPR